MPNIKAKNAVLLIASLVFYAFGEPLYIFWLIFSVFIHWLAGLLAIKKGCFPKALLAAVIVMDVASLAVFKYLDFFVEIINDVSGASLPLPGLRLPVGISFFTFQIMSYIIDGARDGKLLQKSFPRLLLYVSFFPQLIAGPIVKYHDVAPMLTQRAITARDSALGMRRFILGLSKKVIIANTAAVIADGIFSASAADIGLVSAWAGGAAYTLQIFFDFSGYSDMAIGMGRMFGFRFLENFDSPLSARSITDFWRRWHISLTSWFREYLYIPLGGNRRGKARTLLNIMIVFAVTGLWHGAAYTFVLWGIYNGLLMILERIGILPFGKKKIPVLGHVYSLIAVILGFILFRSEDLSQAFLFIKSAFGFSGTGGGALALSFLDPYTVTILTAAAILCLPIGSFVKKRVSARGGIAERTAETASFVICVLLLIYSIVLLTGDTYNPFIYFRF